jgi:predicted RNase H-like nuclease (RuvC/YqgF family)
MNYRSLVKKQQKKIESLENDNRYLQARIIQLGNIIEELLKTLEDRK